MESLKKVYVYPFIGGQDALSKRCGEWLKPPLHHWTAGPARLTVDKGMPSDWQDQGAVFTGQGEVRWWRDGEEYEALFLSDTAVPGLSAADEWEGETDTVLLQDLTEGRVSPSFHQYPTGKPDGKLSVRVYRRGGVVTLVSLRAFVD